MDTRRAFSTTAENERIQIPWEMKKSYLKTLISIGYEHITMPWHGASNTSDMRYSPSPYVLDIPPPYILHISSPHAPHMQPPYDP